MWCLSFPAESVELKCPTWQPIWDVPLRCDVSTVGHGSWNEAGPVRVGHRGHRLQLCGRRPYSHSLRHPLQGLQGAFTPGESASFNSRAAAEEGGTEVPADCSLMMNTLTWDLDQKFEYGVFRRTLLSLFCLTYCSHFPISPASMPFRGAQSELTALRVVARPTTTTSAAQSSYLCCASLGLSICQSVCFPPHRQTMISSSAPFFFIPPHETSERRWRKGRQKTMDCSGKVRGDGVGWESQSHFREVKRKKLICSCQLQH